MTDRATTYRGFHYRWTLPVVGVLGIAWTLVDGDGSTPLLLTLLCIVVILFTFPWDNWAVEQGIWDFPDDRLLLRIRRLPVEEISFFVIQTLQVAFLTAILCRFIPAEPLRSVEFTGVVGLRIGAFVFLWAMIGWMSRRWRLQRRYLRYAWHLGFWFVPVIALQWLFGAGMLAPRLDVVLIATTVIGSYLSVADIWAVRRGIWFFDHGQTTGFMIAGILPWEEVAFFFVTSLLVAQSTILLIPAAHP